MKHIKVWITLLVIFIIICIILLVVLLNTNEPQEDLTNQYLEHIDADNNPGLILNGVTPKKVNNENIYYTVEYCIKQYINDNKSKLQESVYNILNKDYIDQNNITIDNLFNKIAPITKEGNLLIEEMYELSGVKYSYYYVKCNIDNTTYFINVNIDTTNGSFDINFYDQSEYENAITQAMQTQESTEKTIPLNKYNKVNYSNLSEEEIVNKYLVDYVEECLYNSQMAYEKLNEIYRNLRFNTYEKFQEYIQENKTTLEALDANHRKTYQDFNNFEEYEKYIQNLEIVDLDKYLVENNENYKTYTCIDDYGNYYIFNIYNVMDYDILLDNYTIETQHFVEEYNQLSSQEKVMVNIDKYFRMINSKDFETAYSKLDETFRNNNLKSLNQYIEYTKKHFYEYNKIEYLECTQQENTYLYKIKITDATIAKSQEISLTIVMQLKEGTDFVMSFSV